MIGDNAESDAAIYLGVKLFAEGRISRLNYLEFLDLMKVPRLEALQLLRRIKIPSVKIDAILIRRLPGYTLKVQEPLTDPILQFDNYFEAFLLFLKRGLVDIELLPQLASSFHKYHGISTAELHRYLELLMETAEFSAVKDKIALLKDTLVANDSFSRQNDAIQLLRNPSLDAFNSLSESEILQLVAKWQANKFL